MIVRTKTTHAASSYITHGGIGAVLLRALKAGMPVSVWERGGDGRFLSGG
jgi:hypothetical protein